ncbi:MAG: orotidine-5'-phosphate decarboxylase [Candidatus Levybacteria bacterium]|nr:orotidine-5'-phosphate decarboxylase [Candidatus Levybacteria bacterium]
MTFLEQLEETIAHHNSLLCVGLDSDIQKIPSFLQPEPDALYLFNKAIVDATSELVCSYKINIAFYSAYGEHGINTLMQTITYIKDTYEHIPVILDAKRSDIGNTAGYYAHEVFDVLEADAVTVNPYMGLDSMKPFFERKDRGVIVLCRTSNEGAKDFQELDVQGKPLYMHVAKAVQTWHEEYKNCLLVVGATAPAQLEEVRAIAPTMFFLVPGIGAQGGDIERTLKAGLRADKSGLIINSSRSIIYASDKEDFALKAKESAVVLRDQINQYRV